ncbi:heavy-metal-associated domain-containing protein [Pseudobutyrivibrio xylanivorans]|uniref:Heavy-metal-associated domain-containing protein n=1 Tax=Pseudobutyrivibrio xylanivorans TaxID=185007 RepID=A0A5P6VSQ6_PSEXY|nr:heavy metal-associated domain-containing protein [Pseudobutyrivibrio xylanivorans]QFJ54234.1 heavy-metal-associated domain-containing protein [Pseudobutyrivibrio xylanivorans]
MVKTIVKVEGMMCGMCEAHVNDAIRNAMPNIKKVSSSHTKGESVIISEEELEKDNITEAISQTGYKVLSIKSEPYQKKFLGLL